MLPSRYAESQKNSRDRFITLKSLIFHNLCPKKLLQNFTKKSYESILSFYAVLTTYKTLQEFHAFIFYKT